MKQHTLSTLLALLILALIVTGTSMADAQIPVELGLAGDFVILTKSGITDVYPSSIIGDVGVSPITGAANHLSCTEVVGNIYSVDAAGPAPCSIMDPTRLTTAISNMETACVDAAGRTLPDSIELGAGDISGRTFYPGLYKWSTGVLVTSDITLAGASDEVWIFQIAEDLTFGNGVMIHLSGGAQPGNIFWQVGGQATLGTTSHFEGIILSETSINMQTDATINGKLFAKTAVTLQMNGVTNPVSLKVEDGFTPKSFTNMQNFPNPFNPSTTINYFLAEAGVISLNIYDIMGNEIAELENGFREAGEHSVIFETNSDLPNGIYLSLLETSTSSSIKRLVLIK